jgi:hypothetical protein
VALGREKAPSAIVTKAKEAGRASAIKDSKSLHGTNLAQDGMLSVDFVLIFLLSSAAHNLKIIGSNPIPATKPPSFTLARPDRPAVRWVYSVMREFTRCPSGSVFNAARSFRTVSRRCASGRKSPNVFTSLPAARSFRSSLGRRGSIEPLILTKREHDDENAAQEHIFPTFRAPGCGPEAVHWRASPGSGLHLRRMPASYSQESSRTRARLGVVPPREAVNPKIIRQSGA